MNETPFEVVTPSKSKKDNSKGIIISLAVVLVLGLAIFLGVILVRQNQDIREEAANSQTCPAVEACPDPKEPSVLRNCTPPDIAQNPTDSICTAKGRIESCGGRQYCCPGLGQAWTTNMSACTATATPTATPTASPAAAAAATTTATSTTTANATATSAATSTTKTPSPTPAKTAAPVPETGTDWPTYLGIGVGVLVIVGSIILAL